MHWLDDHDIGFDRAVAPDRTLTGWLDYWAAIQPDQRFSAFLDIRGDIIESYSYESLRERTLCLAEFLRRDVGLSPGQRVLLAYRPGLEIVAALLACARIGVISVPVPPPLPPHADAALAKLAFVAADCNAAAILTAGSLRWPGQGMSPVVARLRKVVTDDVRGSSGPGQADTPGPILFLQYTSGSTSEPKGVMVSHANVVSNSRATVGQHPVGVSWLPQHHDMGLIGYYLFPLITGGTSYGLAPADFLRRPLLWLETLSRMRATHTSAPNFGFTHCLRKLANSKAGGLDLGSVRVMMNASEPADPGLRRLVIEQLGPHGLSSDAYSVAYGLAEHTLAVTREGRRELRAGDREIASCGWPLPGVKLHILDPATRRTLRDGEIGEIWVGGDSVCMGYWNNPDLGAATFHNRLAGETDPTDYLRTGDLGFVEAGELFVCGRSKDLLIIRGVNHHPQDIERTIAASVPAIRRDGVAVFEGGPDAPLILLVEPRSLGNLPDPVDVSRALLSCCPAGPHVVAIVPPHSILRTTSGKLARGPTRRRWEAGEIVSLRTHVVPSPAVANGSSPKERLTGLLAPYTMAGQGGAPLLDVPLVDLGLDSLGLVMLLDELERLLSDHGAPDLPEALDGAAIQQMTADEILSLADALAHGGAPAAAAVRKMIGQQGQAREADEAARMRADAQWRLPAIPDAADAMQAPRDVLLTGPTGFFGPFLLAGLLRQTEAVYHVVVRAADPAAGAARIGNAMRAASLMDGHMEDMLVKRVRILCGDVRRDRLGLDRGQWMALAERADAIVHNAAVVNYTLNYAALRSANVAAVQELLKLASTQRAKACHLISSTVIFGWNSQAILREEDCNAGMADLDFGYAQSKWVAEQLVSQAGRQGLPVQTYRPAFISASLGGIASPDDIVLRLLAFMINHKLAIRAENEVSLIPADVAAHNIAALIAHGATGGTVHVTADRYHNLAEISGLISRDHGYRFRYLRLADFVAEARRRCRPDEPLHPLIHFLARSQPKLDAMAAKRYDNSGYRHARSLLSDPREDPSLADVVAGLVAAMRSHGMIGLRG